MISEYNRKLDKLIENHIKNIPNMSELPQILAILYANLSAIGQTTVSLSGEFNINVEDIIDAFKQSNDDLIDEIASAIRRKRVTSKDGAPHTNDSSNAV